MRKKTNRAWLYIKRTLSVLCTTHTSEQRGTTEWSSSSQEQQYYQYDYYQQLVVVLVLLFVPSISWFTSCLDDTIGRYIIIYSIINNYFVRSSVLQQQYSKTMHLQSTMHQQPGKINFTSQILQHPPRFTHFSSQQEQKEVMYHGF